jgi:hypothetical protein
MSQRKDAVYSNRKVIVQTSWFGHNVGYVKRGFWLTYRTADGTTYNARSLGTVSTTGAEGEKITDHIVAAVLAPCGDLAYERWIDPAWVIQSTPFPPARVLEFMMSDFSDRATVIQRMEDGLPTGYNLYLTGAVPKTDPRWEPAKLVVELDYGRNELPVESFKYYFVELITVSQFSKSDHKLIFKLVDGADANRYAERLASARHAHSKTGVLRVEVKKVEEIDAATYSVLSNFINTI